MARQPIPIKIKPKDLTQLGELLRGGVQQVRVVLRALALQQLARGVTAPQVAGSLPLTPKAIRQIAHRYNRNGLARALYDKQRPGPAQILDDSQKQRIVAMVCGPPPEGRARWTVRLVAEEAVKRQLVPRVATGDNPDCVAEPGVEAVAGKNVVSGGVERGLHRKNGGRAGHL